MGVNEEPFDASAFARNRQRMMEEDIAGQFFDRIVGLARKHQLLSSEHFTVDGTLIDANASLKSFWRKEIKDEDDAPPASRNKCVDISVAHAEVQEGLKQVRHISRQGVGIKTVGADKGYDRGDFVGPFFETHGPRHRILRATRTP